MHGVYSLLPRLLALQVHTATPQASLQVVSSIAIQQVSALHADTLSHTAPTPHPHTHATPLTPSDVIVVWSEWVRSRVVVARANDLKQPLLTVDLSGHTVRSAALLPVPGGRCALVAGTNGGTLLVWEVMPCNGKTGVTGGDSWRVGPGLSTQISNVSVELRVVRHSNMTGVANAGAFH